MFYFVLPFYAYENVVSPGAGILDFLFTDVLLS